VDRHGRARLVTAVHADGPAEVAEVGLEQEDRVVAPGAAAVDAALGGAIDGQHGGAPGVRVGVRAEDAPVLEELPRCTADRQLEVLGLT